MKWCSSASPRGARAARVDDDELAAAGADARAAARARPARSSASRWRRAGWRRGSSRCIGAVEVGTGTLSPVPNISAGRRAAWGTGRRCSRRRRCACRAPSAARGRRAARRASGRSGCRGTRPAPGGRARPRSSRKRSSMNANASSHETSSKPPSGRRSSGARRRSGSSCSSAIDAPFGQMKPLLKTSSASPRTFTIRSPSSVSSRPQVASQSGQVRMAVRRLGGHGRMLPARILDPPMASPTPAAPQRTVTSA